MCADRLFWEMIPGSGNGRLGRVPKEGESQYHGILLGWFLLWTTGAQSRSTRSHVGLSSEKKRLFIHWFPSLIVKNASWVVNSLTLQACTCIRMDGWIPAGIPRGCGGESPRTESERYAMQLRCDVGFCHCTWLLQQCYSEKVERL